MGFFALSAGWTHWPELAIGVLKSLPGHPAASRAKINERVNR